MKQLFNRMSEYVAQNPYFDIVETKFGYVQIYSPKNYGDAPCEFIPDLDALLRTLIYEVTSDVRDLQLCGEHNDVDLYPAEIEESRRRLIPFFQGLDREEYCLAYMELYFKFNGPRKIK